MLPVTTPLVPITAVPPPATAGVGALGAGGKGALALDDALEDILVSNCHEINNNISDN